MTTNNADFKVKKGLVVADGDVTVASDHSVKAGTFDTNVAAQGVTLTGVTLSADGTDTNIPINITPKGNSSVVISKADINAGTIDATTVGVSSQASGAFTTLLATNTAKITATGQSLTTKGKVSVVNADEDNPAIETNTQFQVNGPPLSGSDAASSKNYAEARIHTDIGNDDVAGTTYNGMGNALVLDQAENIHTGQGIAISKGRSSTGDSWALGREANRGNTGNTDQFTIGYINKPWDDAVSLTNNPLLAAQSVLSISTSGNILVAKSGATLGFVSNSQTTKIKGSASASSSETYTLPPTDGSNGHVLQTNGSGVLSWTPSSSGADGMGAGFQLEDDDGTELTITTSKEIKFIGAGITTNWTDTDNGTDADPYDMTFTLDVDDLGTSANFAAGDLIAFGDSSTAGNDTVKGTVNTLATLFAGAGLTATSAVIAVDADQSGQITAVGTLTGLTVSGAADLNNNLTVDGATISLDATTSLNIDNSNTTNGITIGTATSGVPVSIGHTTSEVTINDNLTVTGDLTVNGTQTFINSTTIELDDKNIELAKGLGNDVAVDGGGVTLKSTEGDKTFNYVNTNTAWTSSENFDIVSGKKYKLGGADIFTNATTLASGVVTSSLTQVGDLANGSIVSGFGTITTTAAITGGSLIADNITIDGNSITSTNINGDITLSPNGTGEVNIAAGNLNYAGTAVTATGAELNVLDGVTAGTVSASLALVVDANKDLATIRNLTSNGTVQAAAVSVDAVAVLDTSRGSGTDVSGATVLASYAAATYKTAKYIYQIKKDTADDTDVGEILVTYEGTSNDVYILEYGMISTGASIGAWSVNYNLGTVELKYTPANDGDHTYTILNTLLI